MSYALRQVANITDFPKMLVADRQASLAESV